MAAERPPSLRDRPLLAERAQRLLGWMLLRLPERIIVRLAGGPPPVIDGQRLDPGVHFLLAVRARRQPFGLMEPTVPAARARYRRETAARATGSTAVRAVRDLTVHCATGALPARLYHPPGGALRAPLLVYFHGGGFVIGDLDTHDEPCRIICRHARTAVLSVSYRLAPEHPFAAAVDDALAAYRWARANVAALGVRESAIAVGGDSAGANLAAVVSQLTARTAESPTAQLLIYPTVDPVTVRPSRKLFADGLFLTARDVVAFAEAYRGGQTGDPRDPRVSPLLAGNLHDLPPTLVVSAGFDMLRDEAEAYAREMRDNGGVARLRRFESLAHGFIHLTDISPTARHAMREIAREWRAMLDGSAAVRDDLARTARR